MPAVAVLLLVLALAPPAHAAEGRLDWPLRPRPAIARTFYAPNPDWQRGHRGVDLVATAGQPVYVAAAGTVVFAGTLADRPVVSIAHSGGLRTTYEPVTATVRTGQRVEAGATIGAVQPGHAGCEAPACLHWGAMWGAAANADYLDPVGLAMTTPVRLKPVG